MTDTIIYGQINGTYFDKQILLEAKDLIRTIFEQDQIRYFNTTGVKTELAQARKQPQAHEMTGKKMSATLRRKNNKKSAQKQLQYVKNKDQYLDLRKNWVQYNEQTFEALNLLVLKSAKQLEEDSVSHAVF